jgi:hypothetical protein
MTNADTDLRLRVMLSVQRALVGEVTPQMRFIAVELSAERVHIIVWHDGEMSAADREQFDACAVTDVAADLWPPNGDPVPSVEFVRCDFPEKPEFRGEIVYGRRESVV